MGSLNQFSIPVRGLKTGFHQYEFDLDQSFFEEFEDSPVQDGAVHVEMLFDKQPDMFVLDLNINGTVKTECDRCLANIDLPIQSQHQLIIKLSASEADEAEVAYLPIETTEINVAKYIYEFVTLSIPMVKVYDCRREPPYPCDEAVLDKLQSSSEPEEVKNPIWEALNKLNPDN